MKRIFLLFILLGLTGCGANLAWLGRPLDPARLHGEVFADAYRRVESYALTPVALAQLAPAALNGLKQIDPALAATATPANTVQLAMNGRILAAAPMPRPGDYPAWARLTMELLRHGMAASPPLARASPEDIYAALFTAMTARLDKYSHYNSPRAVEIQGEWRTGYGGIGVTFEQKGEQFRVMDVFINSPAARVGLKAGDIILAVEGRPVASLAIEEFAILVRGSIGTAITLTTEKLGTLEIVREKVMPTTVSFRMQDDVAIIRITRFVPTTPAEFRAAAGQAVRRRARTVVIDVQHNPGGHLDAAIEIAGQLAPPGLLLRMDGRHPASREFYRASGADLLAGRPLFVLQDGHSASAAEALAAMLGESGRAVIIGSTSFGKGAVQYVGPLPNGGELALTWARMVGPSGRSFVEAGVRPNVCLTAATTLSDAFQQARASRLTDCPKADALDAVALPAALEIAHDNQALTALWHENH